MKYIKMPAVAVSKDGIFTLRTTDTSGCITRNITCLRTNTATKVTTFPVIESCGPIAGVQKAWVNQFGQALPV
jgi:hypothetical protein